MEMEGQGVLRVKVTSRGQGRIQGHLGTTDLFSSW